MAIIQETHASRWNLAWLAIKIWPDGGTTKTVVMRCAEVYGDGKRCDQLLVPQEGWREVGVHSRVWERK